MLQTTLAPLVACATVVASIIECCTCLKTAVADNAPNHHTRSLTSFSAIKTKKDLIESVVKIRTKATLLAKEGLRSAPLAINLCERTDSTEAYAPTPTSNLSVANGSAKFF
jgi:hypothetical protein